MSDREFTISLGRYGVPQVAIDAIIKVFDEKEQFQQENKALQAKNDAIVARVVRLEKQLAAHVHLQKIGLLNAEEEDFRALDESEKILNETESESLAEFVRPYVQIIDELCTVYEPEIEAKYSGTLNFPCRQRDFDSDMDVIKRARRLFSQQGEGHD